ncbi:ABC transporter substrate-binding protein/permease [Vaginisenegalia massiliensis]|uniref:ABC transporter substrate-binding protein/permease n=1 Tax=Vaginisenegalia massiliensis TaxID=2058294 RepID=UPI000F53C203|nr:ABC transporter substrate-binding protein/permease [Vaginisenegalia massiliensis]
MNDSYCPSIRQLSRLFLVISLLIGCFWPNVTSLAADNQPAKGQTFVIATDTTYAPFEFLDSKGKLVGIDIDILNAIAKDQGFKVDYRFMPFSSGIQALESNQVDGMIAAMGVTPERKKSFDFTDAHYQSGAIFAVNPKAKIKNYADLKGKRVAVKIGTQGAELAEKLSKQYHFKTVSFEDSVNMYQDVTSGNSQAVIEDRPVMAYAVKTGTIDLELMGQEIDTIPLAMAVNKGQNPALRQAFNQGLKNIKQSGQYDQIIDRYVGKGAEKTQVDTSLLGQLQQNFPALLVGLGQTLLVTICSIILALIFGVILGLMRSSKSNWVNHIAEIYIDIMRGIPLIVLAFFIYFGIPQWTGITFGAHIAGIATLSLNAAAYIAEIVRGGIQAIAKGQFEAGRSLGLSNKVTMRKIVLPQAFKIMVPSFINQFVITLKDTSILSVIGLVELTQTGRVVIARTYQSGSMWLIVGLMYIIIITFLTKLSKHLEKELV